MWIKLVRLKKKEINSFQIDKKSLFGQQFMKYTVLEWNSCSFRLNIVYFIVYSMKNYKQFRLFAK